MWSIPSFVSAAECPVGEMMRISLLGDVKSFQVSEVAKKTAASKRMTEKFCLD